MKGSGRMDVLTDIPFALHLGELMTRLHITPDTHDAAKLSDLVDRARVVSRPKAVCKESYIHSRGDDTVTIDDVTFTSRALRNNLDSAERAFPMIATCGVEPDQIDLPSDDFLMQFWLDGIKAALLQCAIAHTDTHLDRKYALGKTSAMSPGSGDVTVWPIQQQKPFFSLFGDVKSMIGVELTDSFLMHPNKTVSRIKFPTEIDYRSCQLCHRPNCPSRAAPLDENLWASMQNNTKPHA